MVEKNPAFAKKEFLAAALTPVFIKKLSHHTSCIVSHHHKLWLDDSDNPQHVTALKANLSNLFNHKCGIHDACNPLYCSHRSSTDSGNESFLSSSAPAARLPVPPEFVAACNEIMLKTASQAAALIQHQTTNVIENANGTLAKLTKGKSANMYQGRMWKSRVAFTMLSKMFGSMAVLVLFMTRFPDKTPVDFAGLPWLMRLKKIQDRDAEHKNKESSKTARYVASDSLSKHTKESAGSRHAYTGSEQRNPLVYKSLDDLESNVKSVIDTNTLTDASRAQRILSTGQHTDPDWWRVKCNVVTGSKVGQIVKTGTDQHRGKFVVAQMSGSVSSGISSSPVLQRGILEEPITLNLVAKVLEYVLKGGRWVQHDVGICVHAKDAMCASSLDGLYHVASAKCWLCHAEQAVVNGCPADKILQHVPVERGMEFDQLTAAEVKFHSGDKNQHLGIWELLTAHKTSTKPVTATVLHSTSSVWQFEPSTFNDCKVSNNIVTGLDGKFRMAVFSVNTTDMSIEAVDPVRMVDGVAGVPTVKKPVFADGNVIRHGCDYFAQVVWHMFTTNTDQCVFAARTNIEMFVEMLYWKDWQNYCMLEMVPKAHNYVLEVLLVERVAGDECTPRDVLRQQICDIKEIYKKLAGELLTLKKALKECRVQICMKESCVEITQNLQTLQDMIVEMTVTERSVSAKITAASACAGTYPQSFQSKTDNISKALATSEELVQSFYDAKNQINSKVGFLQIQLQSLPDRVLPSNALLGSASATKQDVMLPPVGEVQRRSFKNRYRSLAVAKSQLQDKLKKHGWGRGGGLGALPTTQDQWIVAELTLNEMLAEKETDL